MPFAPAVPVEDLGNDARIGRMLAIASAAFTTFVIPGHWESGTQGSITVTAPENR